MLNILKHLKSLSGPILFFREVYLQYIMNMTPGFWTAVSLNPGINQWLGDSSELKVNVNLL